MLISTRVVPDPALPDVDNRPQAFQSHTIPLLPPLWRQRHGLLSNSGFVTLWASVFHVMSRCRLWFYEYIMSGGTTSKTRKTERNRSFECTQTPPYVACWLQLTSEQSGQSSVGANTHRVQKQSGRQICMNNARQTFVSSIHPFIHYLSCYCSTAYPLMVTAAYGLDRPNLSRGLS